MCPHGISSGQAVLATAQGCFPGRGDPGVGTAVGGGLRVYQKHDDRVRLGHHLSPTLHPQVGTGVAAAHVEGKVGFPGRCHLGGSASCVAERGRLGCLRVFLPGMTFPFLVPQILEGCFCRCMWGPHQELSDKRAYLWVRGCALRPEPGPRVGREPGAGTQNPRCQRRFVLRIHTCIGHFPSLLHRLCFQLGQ